MKEFILFVLIIALVALLFKNLITPPRILQNNIIHHTREIVIQGKITTPNGARPPTAYKIVLKETARGDFILDENKTELPPSMTVDKVTTDAKIDWLSVFRVGAAYNKADGAEVFASANITVYNGIEAGIATDTKTAGITAGYRWRNIYAGVYTDFKGDTIKAVVAVKVF